MGERILGISCFYHDSAAALIVDGKIAGAAAEERFTGKKHDTSFPANAIRSCLESGKIGIDDIDYVGFYEKPILKFERTMSQHIQYFPWSFKTFLKSMPSWINERSRLINTLKKIGYRKDVLFIDHHMSHAASSFLPSPFEESAILTVDGVGEWATTAYGTGKGNDIHLKKMIYFPSSLGLMYSAVTAYLGFSVNNSEYKVMGLAAYGMMDRSKNTFYRRLRKIVDIKVDGSYRLDMSYFLYHYSDRMPSEKLCNLLGGPARREESRIETRHKDIAAAAQMLYEDIFFAMLRHIKGRDRNG